MPSTFDVNKYKKIFEQRYGAGSFDAGLSQAREIGRLKTQAKFAKQQYLDYLKEQEKKAKKKTYNDALAYWSDPANKAKLRKEGAYRNAEKIRNDPRLQAEIKDQGYNVDDYIDAMYNAASDGKFRSEREYKKFAGLLQKQTNQENKARDQEYKNKYGMTYQEYSDLQKQKPKPTMKKDNRGLLERFTDFLTSKDVNHDGNRDGLLGLVDRYVVPISKGATDFLFPGNTEMMAQHDKNKYGKVTNPVIKAAQKDRGLETKILNSIGTMAAAATPYSEGYKAADFAFRKIPALAKIANPYVQKAIKGAGAGALAEAGISAINELANPKAHNIKDYAIRSGVGALSGAVLDPALHGLGNLAKNVLSKRKPLGLPEPRLSLPAPKELTKQPNTSPLEFRETKFVKNNYDLEQKLKDALKPARAENPKLIGTAKPGDFEAIKPLKVNDGGKLIRVSDTQGSDIVNPDLLKNIKDIKQHQVGTTDLYRLAERLPSQIKTRITGSLDNAKKSHVEFQKQLTDDLYDKIVKGLGIKKGSKESALVQDFGEKTLAKRYLRKRGIDPNKLSPEELDKINLQQLKKAYPDKWKKIVEADSYFRKAYNKLIDEVNKVRAQIYPNQPDKLVPKRKDYYHHFNELTGLEGVRNLFDTPANIDPHLEGVSPYTKPKTKFQGFMQKRGLGKYKSDAVGGFLKYLQAASHSINIDPVIPVLRKTANEIADATTETRNANKIIEALQDHANDLAGKTNPYDRVTQKVLGRKTMGVLNWLNSRVKSNMVLGNLSSALGQLGNVPLGVGKAKLYALPGLKDTTEQLAKELFRMEKDAPIYKSNFIKERFADKLYRRFDQKLIQQPKKLAVWMMETADRAGTSFIWNSMYRKGLKEGVADPIKYADYETRKIVAGRGVGEVPLAQKSKTLQVLAPFTLEVGNQWKVLKEMLGEKDASGIITFLIASYGLNKAVEQLRGNGVSFDPIDALIDGYSQTEGSTQDKIKGALGSLAGEVIGNIPGGNLITNASVADKKIPFTNTRFQDLFGNRDPNRFGSGLTLSKIFQDPLYLAAPFGASQFRKTTTGLDAIMNEGVYKGDNGFVPFTGDKAQLQYPIETNPLKNLQLLLMGPNAVPEARDYYNNKRRPLSEKQTNAYEEMKKLGMGKEYYNNLMTERRAKTIERNIKAIQKDKNMTPEEKRAKIFQFLAELQKLQK